MRTEAAARTSSKIGILKKSTQFPGKKLQILLWEGSVIIECFKESYLEVYSGHCQTYMVERFCANSYWFSVILQKKYDHPANNYRLQAAIETVEKSVKYV